MRKLLLWSAVLLTALTVGATAGADKPQSTKSKSDSLMRKKLDHAQQMLAGLVTEDFRLIASHAEDMNDLGLLEKWEHADSAGYQTQLQVFRFANNELQRLAEEKNLDGTTLAYMQMTMSCVNCHRFIRQQPE